MIRVTLTITNDDTTRTAELVDTERLTPEGLAMTSAQIEHHLIGAAIARMYMWDTIAPARVAVEALTDVNWHSLANLIDEKIEEEIRQ